MSHPITTRRLALALAAALGALALLPAAAQQAATPASGFPSKMVRIVVPFSRAPTTVIGVPASAPPGNVREQSQQIQQQYKKALEDAMNQPHPEPDEAK